MNQLTTFRGRMESELDLPDLLYQPIGRPQRMAASDANGEVARYLAASLPGARGRGGGGKKKNGRKRVVPGSGGLTYEEAVAEQYLVAMEEHQVINETKICNLHKYNL
jgi:hypothetical protein